MNLFWKLFASIGVAMVVTLTAAVYVSYGLASATFDQVNIEGREPIIREAAEVLAERGERGLRVWLRDQAREAPRHILLLVVDENGRELLGRAMPREVMRLLDRRPPRGGRPPNLRPIQLTPDVVAPDGEEYRLLFTRPLFTVFGVLAWPGTRLAVMTIAILVAAVTSLLLARYLSAPIVRLQRASRALAAGVLETRVGSPSNQRSDEVGILARDFDTMAERIQALVTDKDTLLRDVSHELRSPLARMRMALALAQRRANDAAQPDLSRIEKAAEQLDELIGQILTLARLRTQEPPKREPLPLDELVTDVLDDARFEHPDAQIEFHTDGPVVVLADKRGLRSAVDNVVRNALSYAGADGPIEVRLERSDDGFVLRVRDSGPGVPEEDLTRIFEPFFRGDGSRDHRTTGQGIGLAITARVMELHGGQVTAANRADGGLEITLRFPADA
jgi:two-component system sensor histidine kinase CpxA